MKIVTKLIHARKIASMTTLLGLSSIGLNALAINGVYDYGMGQINRGMGGAGTAMPADAFATVINPAGLGEVKHNFDAGAAVYFPLMYSKFSEGTASGLPDVRPIAGAPGKFDSKMHVFFMPDLAYLFHMDKNNHFGLSANAIGGFGTKYQTKRFASVVNTPVPVGTTISQGLLGDGTVYSSLKIGSLNASYNYVVDQFFSVGLTLSYYVQAFESKGAQGLAAFTTRALQNDGNTALINKLSNNGNDYNQGVGITFGALIKPYRNLTLAFTGTPTVKMSKMKDYKDLFPNKGELDIPGKYVAAARYQASDRLDLVFDAVRILNREVDVYGNNSRALFDGRCVSVSPNFNSEQCVGGKDGVGFGWSNQTLLKVGGAYKLSSRDTVRLGVSYGNRIAHSKDILINILAPGAAAKWITSAGYSRKMNNYNLNSFLTVIPKQSMDGQNELSAGSAQKIKFEVAGVGFGLGISM